MRMSFTWVALLITAFLFFGMLATFEFGRRIGAARLTRHPDGLTKGAGAAEGAIFALLGLAHGVHVLGRGLAI
jgi:hypothetical protein